MMMKLLYWLTYGTLYLLSLLPLRVHYIISDFIYLVVYHLVGYRVKLVRKNLAESFPEKSETELRQIERDFYRWFCDYLVETVKLLTISEKELKRRMVFKGTEIVDEVVESGQSCAAYPTGNGSLRCRCGYRLRRSADRSIMYWRTQSSTVCS